jgi:hypothetical protein
MRKHYTPEPLAKYLISLLPIEETDVLLDPACGENRVFFRNFPSRKKDFCEVQMSLGGRDAGKDFLEYWKQVDWAITNPPFHLYWPFVEHASMICRKGFAFLTSSNAFLSYTPKRLTLLSERGFGMTNLHVLNIKQWFGRYYFVVFQKGKGSIISWSEQTW